MLWILLENFIKIVILNLFNEIKYQCTGGCPLIAQDEGNIYGKSPNCNIYKALYNDVLILEAKRILKYEKAYSLN